MSANSIAIIHAHPSLPENGDAQYVYKPNTDVIWLSGVVQEKTMVIF